MASEAKTSFRSTKETTNYARLCRLLVDLGSQVLRTTFDKIHRPENLGTLLSRKATHSLLLKLREKQVLNAHQWEKLYPQSLVSSQNFDTPLLTVLLKNICGLVPPACCWDRPPPTENITPEADIVRITLYRDTVYSYAEGGAVDDKTFNLYWKDITDVLVRLGGACYQNAINRIKTECMTSDFEKYYPELLKNWYQDDDTIEEREDRALEDLVAMFGGLNLRVRTEAFEKSSYLPMRSSDSFKKKRAQLRPFKEERRKTISSFYDGERRRRPGAIKNEQKRRPGVMSCDETSFTSINRSGDDMDSMANDYSFSVGNDECGQSPPISENEYPWREHVLTCNLRYLRKILNKTSRSVALNTTGERENDPANQTVEKKGVQEDTGDKGKAEAAVTQRIHETNTQGEPNPSNETTVEAERQPMATLIQESPRPVCSHFLRQCFVRFPCCGKFFPCHLCHNESDCIADQAKAIDATHIRCTICYNEQVIDENSQRCGSCKSKMSEYFCAPCKQFASLKKNPFHCTKCGICRLYRDKSFHCDGCNVCLEKRLEGKHKCRPDLGHDECCICRKDGLGGCRILPCSHKVHKDCANAMKQNRYLRKMMTKFFRSVSLNTTGERENDPANQTVEKKGVQEDTGDMGKAKEALKQPIQVTETQRESTPSNETTVEAEWRRMATLVQESPSSVCSHYVRKCFVLFLCCGKFFPCHRCHNESDCTENQARAIDAPFMRCAICYNVQVIDENSQRCGSCNSKMSEYFCATCQHFTSYEKNPFHCTKCGICRIYSDRSFHCDVCNVCLDKHLEGKHKCRPNSAHDECCICLEDAFSGCQILPCSHKVHKDCAIAMIRNGLRTCPICRHPLFGQLQTSPQ